MTKQRFHWNWLHPRLAIFLVASLGLQVFQLVALADLRQANLDKSADLGRVLNETEKNARFIAGRVRFLESLQAMDSLLREKVYDDRQGTLTTPFNPRRFAFLNLFDPGIFGLKFHHFKYEPLKEVGMILYQDFVLELSGEFPAIANFIRELEGRENRFVRVIRVEEIVASPGEGVNARIAFRLHFNRKSHD